MDRLQRVMDDTDDVRSAYDAASLRLAREVATTRELLQQVKTIVRKKQQAMEQLTQLQSESLVGDEELDALKKDVKEVKRAVAEHVHAKKCHTTRLDELRHEVDAIKSDIVALQKERSECKAQLTSATAAHELTSRELADASYALGVATSRKAALESETRSATQHLSGLVERLASTREEALSVRASLSMEDAAFGELTAKRDAVREESDRLTKELKSLEDVVQRQRHEVAERRADLVAISRQMAALEEARSSIGNYSILPA